MLRIDANQNIRINKGDDARFALLLNVGDNVTPIRRKFGDNHINVVDKSANIISVQIKSDIFIKTISTIGLYRFVYKNNHWTLNNNEIDLLSYGLTINAQNISENNYFVINYTIGCGDEIYFVLLKRNHPAHKNPIFIKTIRDDGTIITTNARNISTISESNIVFTDKNDVIISLQYDDTICLEEKEYRYVIKARLLDLENAIPNTDGSYDDKYYYLSTITNRHPFYVIDDDYDREW